MYGGRKPDPFSNIEQKLFVCIITFILLLMLFSCRTQKSSTSHAEYHTDTLTEQRTEQREISDMQKHSSEKKDSTENTHIAKDSTHVSEEKSDSLVVRDSTFVQQNEDGSRIEKYFHWEFRTMIRNLILYRNRESADYLLMWHEASDSVSELKEENASLRDSLRHSKQNQESITEKKTTKASNAAMYVVLLIVGLLLIAECIAFFKLTHKI